MSAIDQQVEIERVERFFYERWQVSGSLRDWKTYHKWRKAANKAYKIVIACDEALGVDGDF